MANVKISELRANTNPSGQEELAYAKNGSNGKITLNTIKDYVWQGWWGGGWGWENPANKTQEIFSPGTLPDSKQSNTWIFTSDWMHWVEFVWSQAKVYEMATAFDVDWENTLLTTVTAPGDINMWLLNNDWTRLILLWYKSSWRIMYWINTDEGWEAFMFDPNSPEYTYNEYENRWELVPYFKSTTDLVSWDYDNLSIYSNAKWDSVSFSDLKFIGITYGDRGRRYVYCPETDEYGQVAVWNSEWNEPGAGWTNRSLEMTKITVILDLWNWRSGPTYMYWDPLQTWTDWWYRTYSYSSYHQPSYPNSEDQFYADWNWSIWTMNDTIQFIWWSQKYLSSDRYLWYNTTKQIVTTYNVKWYGNPEPDDTINVPSFTRFTGEIDSLQNNKQDKFSFTPENIALKITESNKNPRWLIYNVLDSIADPFSISFYSNWTKALAAYNYQCAIIDVITPYNITAEELENATRSNNYDWGSFSDTGWNIFLSENWDYLVAKDWNNDYVYIYELSTPRDVSTITHVAEYSSCRNTIYEGSWTYVWMREYDSNDQVRYWNKYSCANLYEYDHATLTFIEHQWSINPFDDLWVAINNSNSETMFSLDWTQILINMCDYESWARVYDLSTPFDLSTIDANNYKLLPDGWYKWQPCWDFIFGCCYKYWYNPNSAYPSLNNVIDWVALAYTPVEWTINSGTVTISWTQFFTELTDLDSNITIDFTDVIPWMKYIVHWNSTQQIDVTIWNTVYEVNRSQYWWTFQPDWEMYMEITAVSNNTLIDVLWPITFSTTP